MTCTLTIDRISHSVVGNLWSALTAKALSENGREWFLTEDGEQLLAIAHSIGHPARMGIRLLGQ